jgi:hypothetical protein
LVLQGKGFVDSSALLAVIVNGWKECTGTRVLSDEFLLCFLGFGVAGVNMSVTLVTKSFAVVTSESIVSYDAPSVSLVTIEFEPRAESSVQNVVYVSDSIETIVNIEGTHFHPDLTRLGSSLQRVCNETRIQINLITCRLKHGIEWPSEIVIDLENGDDWTSETIRDES